VTDDEAFIRAIVDSPGDDTPRLVYADWLDERADPRGPYLRAEADAVRRLTGTPEGQKILGVFTEGGTERGFTKSIDKQAYEMWEVTGPVLAAGLDPVWVARVSRPPYGVCLEHFRIRVSPWGDCIPGPALAPEDFEAFEEKHRIALPAEYRAFLLNQNGGRPPPCRVSIQEAFDLYSGVDNYVGDFTVIPPVGGRPAGARCPKEAWVQNDPGGAMLYIADDWIGGAPTGFYLGLSGDRRGRVFYYHPTLVVRPYLVAASFSDFLGNIRPKHG
jgi:uncharacterized protein (TIGR02996 family)